MDDQSQSGSKVNGIESMDSGFRSPEIAPGFDTGTTKNEPTTATGDLHQVMPQEGGRGRNKGD